MDADAQVVVMENVTKAFAGVRVLHDGSLTVRRGEIHALMGANGAGKSTLMKILTGVYQKDSGSVRVATPPGRLDEVSFSDPRAAQRAGIAIVHQELILVESMTVADNIALGREPLVGASRLLNRRETTRFARNALERIGARINPGRLVEQLTPAEKQLVEISRALAYDARVLVLDEPTTSLSTSETHHLHSVLRALRADGLAIVYISHRMDEIFALTDTVTVMRDGRFVASMPTADVSRQSLIRQMIGRELAVYERELARESAEDGGDEEASSATVVLEVEGLLSSRLHDVGFKVRAGEILGIFGLVGAGRTELARAVFGVDRYTRGAIRVLGIPLPMGKPHVAAARGIGLVPEDRKTAGLVLDLPLIRNIELARLRDVSVFKEGRALERTLWATYRGAMGIVARGPEQITRTLSGGNQQKVVLAKWLATAPRVLILDEPTRGIDVGAKQDIYELIRSLAKAGMAVVVISSESEEIEMLSDSVLVMREGAVTFSGSSAGLNDERLLTYAMGEER